jgi:hypothetical protein
MENKVTKTEAKRWLAAAKREKNWSSAELWLKYIWYLEDQERQKETV